MASTLGALGSQPLFSQHPQLDVYIEAWKRRCVSSRNFQECFETVKQAAMDRIYQFCVHILLHLCWLCQSDVAGLLAGPAGALAARRGLAARLLTAHRSLNTVLCLIPLPTVLCSAFLSTSGMYCQNCSPCIACMPCFPPLQLWPNRCLPVQRAPQHLCQVRNHTTTGHYQRIRKAFGWQIPEPCVRCCCLLCHCKL